MTVHAFPGAAPTYVVVGGGQAGAVAAATLRTAGFTGRVVLVGAEAHLPYERPPLSKEVLVKPETAKLGLYAENFYADQAIECRFGVAAQGLDPDTRELALSSGETLRFDKVLLATGARARRYPLLDQLGGGVFTIRTLDDAEALRGHLWPGRRLLVVGGGVIGLEVAASATVMGAAVTVLERGDRLMARAAPDVLARHLRALHERHGVRFAFGADIIAAERDTAGEIRLGCADGRVFTGDLVVYGIGVELNVDLAVSAGLRVEDGIVVDEYGRSSHPQVYAAGDVARQWNPASGQSVRQETWANAQNQAAGVARAMVTGQACTFEVPWYWTDQFGGNFQVAGAVAAERWISRGEGDRQTLFGVADGRVVGAVTINNGRDMRFAKTLIAAHGRLADLDALGDPSQDLRRVVAACA